MAEASGFLRPWARGLAFGEESEVLVEFAVDALLMNIRFSFRSASKMKAPGGELLFLSWSDWTISGSKSEFYFGQVIDSGPDLFSKFPDRVAERRKTRARATWRLCRDPPS